MLEYKLSHRKLLFMSSIIHLNTLQLLSDRILILCNCSCMFILTYSPNCHDQETVKKHVVLRFNVTSATGLPHAAKASTSLFLVLNVK